MFVASFGLPWLHIPDDALITNEPAWYGISIPEFLLYCAVVYAIVPPLGLWLARRGSIWGLFVVANGCGTSDCAPRERGIEPYAFP